MTEAPPRLGEWCTTPAEPVVVHWFALRKDKPPALKITAVCGLRAKARYKDWCGIKDNCPTCSRIKRETERKEGP